MLTPLEADNLSILPGIRHGFFTRQGGASRGLYAQPQLRPGLEGRPRRRRREPRAASPATSAAPGDDVQTLYQVHSATALVVDTLVPRETLPKADALVTRTRGLAIGVLTADCTPVLFADPEARVVGAAHAGWRGALAGVLEATVAAMETLGAERKRILAALGPSIGPKSYEVGPEFEAEFLAADPANSRFFRRAERQATPALRSAWLRSPPALAARHQVCREQGPLHL